MQAGGPDPVRIAVACTVFPFFAASNSEQEDILAGYGRAFEAHSVDGWQTDSNEAEGGRNQRGDQKRSSVATSVGPSDRRTCQKRNTEDKEDHADREDQVSEAHASSFSTAETASGRRKKMA